MVGRKRLDAIHADTQRVYDTHGAQFERDRNRSLFEKPWLDRFCAGFPKSARVLDLGCGGGGVIATYLIDQGFQLTGVDFAPSMIELARQRHPDHTWLVQDMSQLDLDGPFEGVISWNGFFHLTPDEQRRALPKMARLVSPTGRLLLTVGHEASEVTGTVAGESVYHASLAEAEYRALLAQEGFKKVTFRPQDPTCHLHSILMASRD
ncbi:MAG: class I SAM-dependent methyltransferase [Hyphomicrobiales bacterium]|nr:class I SAM-dependent methyltransferase [Hyphomicrobiales bacterium]